MSNGIPPDGTGHGDVLDWLYERGKQRSRGVPEFDIERTIGRARAARDAGTVDFWSILSPTERRAFESAAHRRTFPAGIALMREGAPASEVMVIVDGWTKVCVEQDGRERIIAERGPGDLVGEGGTVPGNVRSASVIALGTVQALVMKTAIYAAFVGEHPGVPDLVEKQTYDRRTDRPGPFSPD
jgi:CRP-like cAMP-binding protein